MAHAIDTFNRSTSDFDRDKRRVLALTEEVARLQSVIADLQAQASRASHEHDHDKQRQADALLEKGNQMVGLLQENQKLQELYIASQAKCEAITSQLETLQLSARRKDATAVQQQTALTELHGRYEEVCTLVADVNADLERERAEADALRSAMMEAKQREKELVSQLQDTTGATTGVASRAREAMASVEALRAQNDALIRSLEERDKALTEQAAELAALRDTHDNAAHNFQTQMLELGKRVHLHEMIQESQRSVHPDASQPGLFSRSYGGIGRDLSMSTTRSPSRFDHTTGRLTAMSPDKLSSSHLTGMDARATAVDRALQEAVGRAAAAEVDATSFREELLREQSHINSLQQQMAELQNTAAALGDQNAKLVDELQRTQTSAKLAADDVTRERNKNDQLQQQIIQLSSQVADLSREYDACQHRLRLVQTELDQERRAGRSYGDTADAAVKQAESLSQIVYDKDIALKELTVKYDALSAQMGQQHLSEADARARFDRLQRDLDSKKAQLLDAQREITRLHDQLNRFQLQSAAPVHAPSGQSHNPPLSIHHSARELPLTTIKSEARIQQQPPQYEQAPPVPSAFAHDGVVTEIQVRSPGVSAQPETAVSRKPMAPAASMPNMHRGSEDDVAEMKFRLMRSETERRLLKMEVNKLHESKTPTKTPVRSSSAKSMRARSQSAEKLQPAAGTPASTPLRRVSTGYVSADRSSQVSVSRAPKAQQPAQVTVSKASPASLRRALSHISERSGEHRTGDSESESSSVATEAVLLDRITSSMDMLKTGPGYGPYASHDDVDSTEASRGVSYENVPLSAANATDHEDNFHRKPLVHRGYSENAMLRRNLSDDRLLATNAPRLQHARTAADILSPYTMHGIPHEVTRNDSVAAASRVEAAHEQRAYRPLAHAATEASLQSPLATPLRSVQSAYIAQGLDSSLINNRFNASFPHMPAMQSPHLAEPSVPQGTTRAEPPIPPRTVTRAATLSDWSPHSNIPSTALRSYKTSADVFQHGQPAVELQSFALRRPASSASVLAHGAAVDHILPVVASPGVKSISVRSEPAPSHEVISPTARVLPRSRTEAAISRSGLSTQDTIAMLKQQLDSTKSKLQSIASMPASAFAAHARGSSAGHFT